MFENQAPFTKFLSVKKFFYLFLPVVLIVLCNSDHSLNRKVQGQSETQSCLTCSEPTQRTIYAPVIELPEAERGDIVLNCRSLHEMEATPTFYTSDGQAIVGDRISLQPSEIRFVTVESLIPVEERGKHIWGGMSFSYTGRLMEVWAQITLRGRGGHSSTDVTFSVLNNAGANTQEAVWWMPDSGKAVIALGNSSSSPIHTTLQFAKGENQELDIAPFATSYVRRGSDKKSKEMVNSGVGESVKITTTGAAGSLKVVGYVYSDIDNFTSSIRFYETANAVQQHLFATNFRVKNALAHILLKNTSESIITATPHFRPNEGEINAIRLPAIALAPGETKELNLQPLQTIIKSNSFNQAVIPDQFSIYIENSGAPGSLIGALYNTDQGTGVTQDISLRDSGVSRNATGAYPWRLDDDYQTLVSITNVGSEKTHFTGAIHYNGGQYMLGMRELAAGQTAVFDMRKIRDQQIPDQDGNVIPLNITSGQFRWSITKLAPSESRIIGRSEVISRSRGVSISYSCPKCCRDSGPYFFDGFPVFRADVGETTALAFRGTWIDCYDDRYDTYGGFFFNVYSSDNNIAQIDMFTYRKCRDAGHQRRIGILVG